MQLEMSADSPLYYTLSSWIRLFIWFQDRSKLRVTWEKKVRLHVGTKVLREGFGGLALVDNANGLPIQIHFFVIPDMAWCWRIRVHNTSKFLDRWLEVSVPLALQGAFRPVTWQNSPSGIVFTKLVGFCDVLAVLNMYSTFTIKDNSIHIIIFVLFFMVQ